MGSGLGEASDCGDGDADGNDDSDGGSRTDVVSGAKARVALFVDGISDSISYHQIRGLFAQFGCLVNVSVKRFRRPGRRFRFAFVCFSSLKAATTTIKRLDGFRLGKYFLLVSLAKPPIKAAIDFDTKVSAIRLSYRISVSGLGAPSWRDVVVGLKKESQVFLYSVGEVAERHAIDRNVVSVPWMSDLEGFSIVGDRGELGLSIPDEVLFPEAFGSFWQGGSTLDVGGRDAFIFPEIGCPFEVVENVEGSDASSMAEVLDDLPFLAISPLKAFSELTVDSSQALSVFSSSINRLGIRGIIFNDNSVGAILVTLVRNLVFREGKVLLALPFDIRVPLSFHRSSPDVFLMDSFLGRRLFALVPLRSFPPAETVDVGSYSFDPFHPSVSDDGLGFLPPRLEYWVLVEDGGVAQHQPVDMAAGLVVSSSDVLDVLSRRRGRPKKVKRGRKPRQVPPTTLCGFGCG